MQSIECLFYICLSTESSFMNDQQRLQELLERTEKLSIEIENHRIEINKLGNEIRQLAGNEQPLPLVKNTRNTSSTTTVAGLENFIGLKLINFVGIIVLIIGLTIGVKYAIDINLISAGLRIALAYMAAILLFFASLRFRKKYQLFSIILFSGSMASAYFTTYAAYEYYNIIPRAFAFMLMLVFTFFTVFNSLKYNRQEIAILGLVGAYGIPFFVKGNSDNIVVLFSYMFIINSGVLLVSFRKYWLSLTYISFFTTWLIYLSWIFIYADSNYRIHVTLFCFVFYIFFLLNSLAFRAVKHLSITPSDTLIVVLNTAFLYISLLMLHKESSFVSVDTITLMFGVVYLAAAIVVKKFLPLQQQFYNALFCIALVALVIFAGVKYSGFKLTIIWILMAVCIFVTGMFLRLKIFRIASILLFAATLVKLLLVDSVKFSSVEKVIAYLFIGTVLLVISFLYQRFKKIIFNENDEEIPLA